MHTHTQIAIFSWGYTTKQSFGELWCHHGNKESECLNVCKSSETDKIGFWALFWKMVSLTEMYPTDADEKA